MTRQSCSFLLKSHVLCRTSPSPLVIAAQTARTLSVT
uniref:Uncharacterized protein n=1 Tax=Anguilla anguilla TaxID=7936 RepID=A0A0E9PJI5_ANGAN